MNSQHTDLPYKLAAIDLDGTLLGPDLGVSEENRRALAELSKRGIEVVIASGRHYQSILQFLKILPEVRWVISAQGGEISDRNRGQILGRNFLNDGRVGAVLKEAGVQAVTSLVYAVDGIFTASPENPDLEFYRHMAGLNPQQASYEAICGMPAFKVIWIGEIARMDRVMAEAPLADDVEKVRTHHRIVEFVPRSISKGTGLQALTSYLQILPEQCIAFGDAENDLPMFEWAGLAVSMDHGWPKALAAADIIAAAGPPESSLARGIEAVLQKFPG